jgi:predicted MPP superfamily phosphohydrolase
MPPSDPSEDSIQYRDPSEDSLLHHVLVATDDAQRLPAVVVAGAMLLGAAAAALTWIDQGAALVVGAGALIASGGCWYLLRLLPRRGKSFGGEKASALGLSAAFALTSALLGVLNVDALLALIGMALIAGIAVYATWIEPFKLGLTHETLQTAGWTTPITVLHIGDIHVERITDRERKLNRLIHLVKPDVIVFTGDFVNLSYTHDERAYADIRQIIGEWRAPLGVYCVPGTPTVEPLERVKQFVAGLDNLTLLLNEWRTVETPGGKLHLLGMITTHVLSIDRAALHDAMQRAPADGLRLLLAHSPDIAPEAADAGIDWMLSGHTHGGQIRLPIVGALLSASHLGLRFVMGRYDVGQMTLYVSRGVGMEGYGAPRARFLCPPEVILWRVH